MRWIKDDKATLSLQECVWLLSVAVERKEKELA